MTANRTQIGFLAAGLLAVLIAIGCSSDGGLISSGNLVVTYPASTDDPTSIEYSCIRMNYRSLLIKPADGVCSESSGPQFAGRPCGTATDCSIASATCNRSFAKGCDGGVNNNQDCVTDEDCPDGTCVVRGECATIDGVFTGQGCIGDLDCAFGEKCSGECSAGSANEGDPCLFPRDCTLGRCEGAQAADTLGSSRITLINEPSFGIPVAFTPTCPACELENFARPVLCDPDDTSTYCFGGSAVGQVCTSDSECPGGECLPPCNNRCLTKAQLEALNPPIPCDFDKCCNKFGLIAPPCEETADCPAPQCADSVDPLASNVLPEGTYLITRLAISDLRMFAPDVMTAPLWCDNSTRVDLQYDPPLTFTVGAGGANEVRSVIHLAALQGILDVSDPTPAQCTALFNNFPAWFSVESN